MAGRTGSASNTPTVRTSRFPRGRRRAAAVEAPTSAGSAPPMFAPSTRATAPVGSMTCVAANVATSSTMAMLERSEEHTSELQSHSDLVCRLLLEKKKQARRLDALAEARRVELGRHEGQD